MTKLCTKCRRELDVSEFNKNRKSHDGLQGICRTCSKSYIYKRPDVCIANRVVLTKEEQGAKDLYGVITRETIKGYLKSLTNERLWSKI